MNKQVHVVWNLHSHVSHVQGNTTCPGFQYNNEYRHVLFQLQLHQVASFVTPSEKPSEADLNHHILRKSELHHQVQLPFPL